jgi:hypothetical protein
LTYDAPARQHFEDCLTAEGNGDAEGAELIIDDGGVAKAADGNFSGSTYTTHGWLGFRHTKMKWTGRHWRFAHQKGRIGGGVAHASGGSDEGEAGPVDPTYAPRCRGAWGLALGRGEPMR